MKLKKIIRNRHEVSTVAGKSDMVDNNNAIEFLIYSPVIRALEPREV